MADPKQKSLELPPFLRRHIPQFLTPMWVEAARWRNVVRNDPVAIICRDRLIVYLQALPWAVRAKEPKEQDKLEPDIAYYQDYILRDFDILMDLLWQDALDLPIGGNVELVRWRPNVLPTVEHDGQKYKVTQPNPRGHVFRIVNLDGETIMPTFDEDFPLMQRMKSDVNNAIYFAPNEFSRVLLTPRPEMGLRGYGMSPPQRIYLALSLLYYGNQYYARLLLDTPEAGILDLLDMSEQDAREWVTSYQNLLQGVDPQKIGVLYQHNTPAKWIPFGRPPSEMSYDSVTLKYARVVTAGYWLTLQDIGLDPSGKTLAGEIRRQRETRLTGFGMVREKTKNFINKDVLPPYLEFDYIERDDEALANTGRARLLNAQAMKAMKEGGFITAAEGQEQLKKDGLLTVELEKPKEPEQPPPGGPPLPPGQAPPGLPPGKQNGQPQKETEAELKRVPPSQGGKGDVGQKAQKSIIWAGSPSETGSHTITADGTVYKAQLGDPAISATPGGSSNYDRLGRILRTAFDEVLGKMQDTHLRRLIKASLRAQFPISSKAIINLSEADREQWTAERLKAWFDQKSIFDRIPQVQKIDQDVLDQLEELMDSDPTWWQLPPETIQEIMAVLELAFAEGAIIAAELIQQFLYEEGLMKSPDLVGFNFKLKNPTTLAELESKAADLVRHVNKGTKHYLKRIITAGVDQGVSSQEIAMRIQEGQNLDKILAESNLMADVVKQARTEIAALPAKRVESIVNTEINRAESEGRLAQWQKQGLTRKRWAHTGSDVPCRVCVANIERGFIPISENFDSVFGEKAAPTPPGHPGVCHCHLEFDEKELMGKAGKLNVWTGN